jgi:cytochrome c553
MKVAALALAASGVFAVMGQQAVYTDAQAAAGRIAYDAQQPGKTAGSACTDCHTASLLGRTGKPAVPPLAGADFMAKWGPQTTNDLYARIQMVERLSEEQYLSLVAYILKVNGAASGTRPLTRATPAVIRSAAAEK